MRPTLGGRVPLLLLLVPLAACGGALPGESVAPAASAHQVAEDGASVVLVTPVEDVGLADPEDGDVGAPGTQVVATAAAGQPGAGRPPSTSWISRSYAPPPRGRGASGSRGTGGRDAVALEAPAVAAATGGSGGKAGGGGVASSSKSATRKTSYNPAVSVQGETKQNVKKKYTTPYRGRKVRNPENKGKGGGGQ